MQNTPKDINFLEFPGWAISSKKKTTHLIIQKRLGSYSYEMGCPEGIPTRFDKIVLLFLLDKCFKENTGLKISLIDHEIVKSIFLKEKHFKQEKYNRIMLALKRWQSSYIKLENVQKDGLDNSISTKYFSILSSVVVNKNTHELTITLNKEYISQLTNTRFPKVVNFYEYRSLTRPLSARLYENIQGNICFEKTVWQVPIEELQQKITRKKRGPHLLAIIRLAIDDINLHTSLKIIFDYNKKKSLCIFTKITEPAYL